LNSFYDPENELDLGEYPGLQSVANFAQMVGQVPWFSALGAELDEREMNVAEDYLLALGFPDTSVLRIENWQDAADVADNPDWNNLSWDAEEQMRMGLYADACERYDEEVVTLALTHVTNQAFQLIEDSAIAHAQIDRVADEALVQAAIGAGAQCCQLAALVLASEHEDEDQHPFALKYRLFEFGRWPIGVVGGTFHLF
jgi:hypothetical protein